MKMTSGQDSLNNPTAYFYGEYISMRDFAQQYLSDMKGNEGWDLDPAIVVDLDKTADNLVNTKVKVIQHENKYRVYLE